MPGPLGEGQCQTPQIKITLHGAGTVQGIFYTTVQMGVLFPSPNVSSYTLQSSRNLQVVQGAQAMGAKKKQHQPLSAHDTMIYQCLIKTIASPMLGAIPSPSKSLQVLEATHMSPCGSATGFALALSMCLPQAVLFLGRGTVSMRRTLKPRKPRAWG